MTQAEKKVSRQRGVEGAAQTGGVYAVISTGIELARSIWPELPWPQIVPFVGAIAACLLGQQVSKSIHARRLKQMGETHV